MFRFENLEIWKLAVEYGNVLYKAAKQFPSDELYGLSAQLRRAVVSISSNIAEGSGAGTNKNFSNFLDISIKSTLETVSILYFAASNGYITEIERKDFYEQAERIIRKIRAFKKTLR
jgi:four helix bundle protein